MPLKVSIARLSMALLIVSGIAASLFLLFCRYNVEGIYYPNPQISTRYSSGYSEERFQMVTVGMLIPQVNSTLGHPLWKEVSKDGTIQWNYSEDHDPPGRDYAWFKRS